jgi:hypothetical protein
MYSYYSSSSGVVGWSMPCGSGAQDYFCSPPEWTSRLKAQDSRLNFQGSSIKPCPRGIIGPLNRLASDFGLVISRVASMSIVPLSTLLPHRVSTSGVSLRVGLPRQRIRSRPKVPTDDTKSPNPSDTVSWQNEKPRTWGRKSRLRSRGGPVAENRPRQRKSRNNSPARRFRVESPAKNMKLSNQ